MKTRYQFLGAISAMAIALSFGAGAANAAPLPFGWTTNAGGNAGSFSAQDGVVTLAPGLASYQWLSTEFSPAGGGTLPVGATGAETNGTTVATPAFTVAAGDKLNFFFNYITSDGAEFTEYAWAALFTDATTFDSYLFTARTTPSGNTVPGIGLPGLGAGVVLTPGSTAIIPGGPAFSPLGGSSGACFIDDTQGCGYTGWIEMDFTFPTAGTYLLKFGVTNALDDAFDSAFAVAGVTINDVPIDNNKVPEPGTLALLGLGLAGLGVMRRRKA